ncbi:heterokaryon incompatibility protein-domain-containing protein [Echria macrotheca]|uniref:Heterokaryon incompatibility protein-domain-containing protein n=1 Tax=Echria macrotheca TaxID=438768 RepID=A0AAJ0BB28_9PEZI|nr:heterokaryon incompatibility protein-domain-containing protein [Echria macrotheca]
MPVSPVIFSKDDANKHRHKKPICGPCQYFFQKYPRITGWRNVRTTTERAEIGCVTCFIVSQAVTLASPDRRGQDAFHMDVLTTTGPTITEDGNGPFTRFSTEFSIASSDLRVCPLSREEPVALSVYRRKGSPYPPYLANYLPLGDELPISTASEESLHWVKNRLRVCLDTHKDCNTHHPGTLPKRVLDVGNPSEENSRIRLYEPSPGLEGQYLCLSHCWGTIPFLQTSTSNLDDHRREIPWDQLPATFQDAIDITRRLGFRYLWIDSLCIIQDNRLDWEEESARMSSIYQQAVLVLSATQSDNAHKGMYSSYVDQHRPEYTLKPLRIPTTPDGTRVDRSPGSVEHTVWFRQSLLHIKNRINHDLPTSGRGWILQERILAPRIAHFGLEEIAWECSEDSICQCTTPQDEVREIPYRALPFPDDDTVSPTAIRSSFKRYQNPLAWQSASTYVLDGLWRNLVEVYSELALSKDGDIFPAISGLAKAFQRARKSDYVAGMWRESLLSSLLWFQAGGNPWIDFCELCEAAEGTIDEEYNTSRKNCGPFFRDWKRSKPLLWRAPSWSWASVSGSVGFFVRQRGVLNTDLHEGLSSPLSEIINVVVTPASQDPTGEIDGSESYITIRGPLIPATVRINKSEARRRRVHELDIFKDYEFDAYFNDDCYFRHLMGGFDAAHEDFHFCPYNLDVDGLDDRRLGLSYLPGWSTRYETDDFQPEDPKARVYCLGIGRGERRCFRWDFEDSAPFDFQTPCLYFLILRRVNPSGESDVGEDPCPQSDGTYRYQRVGVARVFQRTGGWEEAFLAQGREQTVTIY